VEQLHEGMGSAGHHPAVHRLRVPFRMQIVFGSRRFFAVFSLVMATFSLYGPIAARAADHNGYRYVLGPLATALVGLIASLLLPSNPYRSLASSERYLHNLDKRDEDAHRLVEILQSSECRRASVLAAARFAGIVSFAMVVLAAIFYSSLSWTLKSPWQVMGLGGGVLFAWLFIRIQSTSWALMKWWNEAGQPSAPIE